MYRKKLQWIFFLALAAALIPFVLPASSTFQFTQLIAIGIALMGLNVFTGWAGQPSLGHGAFFGLGAYLTAILLVAGVPWWLAMLISALGVAMVAMLLGQPLLKLSHTNLALATLAMALAFPQLLRHPAVSNWTGGSRGLEVTGPVLPAWANEYVSNDALIYWVALVVAVIVAAVLAVLGTGRVGLVLRSIRDNPVAAQATGTDVAKSKLFAFAGSASAAALGGSIYVLNVEFIGPESFQSFLSLMMLVSLVVGGPGTLLGPWIGAAFLQFVPAWAERISTAMPWGIFGLAVLLVAFFAPRGIAGLVPRVNKYVVDIRSKS